MTAGVAAQMIICGDDTLVVRMAEELDTLGESAVVVLAPGNPEVEHLLAETDATVVIGRPTDAGTLLTAGVRTARALALVGDGDEANLHAALAATELNPRLRLVVRMFNLRLGQRIEELFDDCVVLSASAIAAPFFVDAALGDRHGRTIPTGVRTFSAGPPHAIDEPLLPLASRDAEGQVALLPAFEDSTDNADDGTATLVLGTPRSGLRPTIAIAGGAARRLRQWLASAAAFTDLRLRIALAGLAGLVVIATALFKLALPLGWMQALYFTVTTVTTTGYGDINLAGAPGWLQLAGIVVMLLGVLVVALLTASVVDNLVAARLLRARGLAVGQREDHVVVCGMGTVGLRVCEQLRAAGVDVVGVEHQLSAATIAAARRLDIPVIDGDASDLNVLASAGVGRARCVVAVTDDDVSNLEAGLTARSLRADTRVVLRLFDPDLADRVDRRLGLSVSRSVSYAAAPVFAAAMLGREVLAAIPVGRRVLLVAEVCVSTGSALDGVELSTVDSVGQVRVFGMRTGDSPPRWQPPADSTVVAGSTLYVVATRSGLARILLASGAH